MAGGASSAAAAGFLLLPEIPGEVTEKGHDKWIELESIGVSLPEPPKAGGGSARSLRLGKRFDRSSPRIFEAACRGTKLATAEVELTRPGGRIDAVRYVRIVFENVLITSYAMGGNASGEEPGEEFELSFEGMQWTYTEFDAAGREGNEHLARWDFVRNTGSSVTTRRTLTVRGITQPGGRLGIQWTPESGRKYTLLRSPTPDGPFVPVSELGAFSSGESRWAELPGGRQFDFFLLREDE